MRKFRGHVFPTNLRISLEDGSSSEDLFEDECEAEEESSFRSPLVVNVTRVHCLILDHKQFLAARVIQRHVRGWLVRLRQQKAKLAVAVMQKWWRRYKAQRNLLRVVENTVQAAMMSLIQRSAILIQKVFRGWWSRKHIFDLTKLKSLQILLAEDIIQALGSYLHKSKHKAVLPGLHSIRLPRKCLETTDQLMATLGYRFYNSQACYKMQKAMAKVESLRQVFKRSTEYTDVPFGGFNDRQECEKRILSLELVEKNPENLDLIQIFVSGQRTMNSNTTFRRYLAMAHSVEEARKVEQKTLNDNRGFLKRITHDMKNWRFADGEHILPITLFAVKTENMAALLGEVKASLEDVFGRLDPCICRTPSMPPGFDNT